MALKEVNDERIAFLKKMAENAADIGDDEFVTAANKIIAIIESSYAEIALNQGAKQMASYAVNKVWGKLKDAISDYIPGLKAIETTKEAMDYLFNSTEAAESNIRIVMQYTAGQYALRAMNTAYHNYSTGRTEENAAVFNAAYKNYLAYQDYSSEWAKDFVYAHTLASATTVEDCLTALNSDINYCNNAIMFADRFAKIYNAYAYPNVDVSTSQPSEDEEKGQEEEIEDINTNTSYHSTYAIKQKLTLTGDMNVNGDLYVYAGLDLNGYTLNVTGSVIIEETGYLRMKSSSSNLTIGGDFTTKSSVGLHFSYESYNYFSGGSITIGGDLYQEYASVDNFSLNGTELKFSGNCTHVVSSLSTETDINNFTSDGVLNFKGTFGNINLSDDITIVDNMKSFNNIKTNGYKLNVNGDFNQSGTVTMDIAKLDGGELNISGNYTSNGNLSVNTVDVKINVGGNCIWNSGALTLAEDTVMTVNGDFVTNSKIVPNGTLKVDGNFTIDEKGYLRMKSSSSNLNIGGNFTTKSSIGLHFSYESYNYFSGGSITISGSLYQEYASVDNFSLNGTKLNFVGNETHLISSACSETDINNFTSEGFLDFKGKFGNISLSDDITIVDNMTSFSSIKTNGYNLNVNGDFNQTGTITMDIAKLDGGELNISGNYTSNSDLSISAVEVKVNVGGNCNWNAGILTLAEDTVMTVNGDFVTNSKIVPNGTLKVDGDFTIDEKGYLRMKSSSSNLNIGGDFTTKSSIGLHFSYESYNYFSGGLITIGGDFYQSYASVDNFSLNGTKLNFVGSKTHLISSACSGTDISNFTSDGTLDLKGRFGNLSLGGDITIIDNMTSFSNINTNGYNLDVNGDFNQSGSITMENGSFDGGNFNVSGDYKSTGAFSATNATININGNCTWNSNSFNLNSTSTMNVGKDFTVNAGFNPNGTLIVNKNFTIGEKGYLRMKSTSSNLTVGGDFITKSSIGLHFSYESYNYFSAGSITIGGGLYQSYSSVDNFSLNGTELIFVGKGKHTISALNNGTDISNLTLADGVVIELSGNMNGFTGIKNCTLSSSDTGVVSVKSNTITPKAMGKATVTITDSNNKTSSIAVKVKEGVRGDANMDGEVNIADAVMLQKWLLGTGSLPNWKSMDLCEDGRIDVFDMVAMRKLLIEKTK